MASIFLFFIHAFRDSFHLPPTSPFAREFEAPLSAMWEIFALSHTLHSLSLEFYWMNIFLESFSLIKKKFFFSRCCAICWRKFIMPLHNSLAHTHTHPRRKWGFCMTKKTTFWMNFNSRGRKDVSTNYINKFPSYLMLPTSKTHISRAQILEEIFHSWFFTFSLNTRRRRCCWGRK